MKIESKHKDVSVLKGVMKNGEVYSRGDDTIRLYFIRCSGGVVNLSSGTFHEYRDLESQGWVPEPTAKLVMP